MNVILDKTIHSQKLLNPEMRKPHQTVKFVYKALNVAEKQIFEQFVEIEKLILENQRLSKLAATNIREK
jgi:hypothetical protein